MHRSAHARCILSWDIRGGRDFAGVVGRGIRAIDRHYLNYTKEMSFAQIVLVRWNMPPRRT